MTIKELCKQAHRIACEKGFWGIQRSRCKTKRNVSELLMLVVSELGEACEALRKGERQSKYFRHEKIGSDGFADIHSKLIPKWQKDTFEDELADAIIRICDLAEAEGVDLEWQIKNKLSYNKKREYKHGKKF